MKISDLKPRTMFLVMGGSLFLAFAGSWLAEMSAFTSGMLIPVEVTQTEEYKTFFRNVFGHVKDDEGREIQRSTVFDLNPLVYLQTRLVVVGEASGFRVEAEEITGTRVNLRNLVLYAGLWFTFLIGIYWLMGDGPWTIRSLKLPKDPRHPAWIAVKVVLAGVVLTSILAFSASNFDSTEVVSIATFLLAALGIDSVHLSRLRRQEGMGSPAAKKTDEVRHIRAV